MLHEEPAVPPRESALTRLRDWALDNRPRPWVLAVFILGSIFGWLDVIRTHGNGYAMIGAVAAMLASAMLWRKLQLER